MRETTYRYGGKKGLAPKGCDLDFALDFPGMAKNRQQLPFLELQPSMACSLKKRRKVEASGEASSSSTSMTDFVYKSDAGLDLDDDSDGGDTSEQVPKPKKDGNQQYITFNKPTVATTVVMTSIFASLDSVSTDTTSTSSRFIHPSQQILPPGDIASELQQFPVQPNI